jgi:hypothetical protein
MRFLAKYLWNYNEFAGSMVAGGGLMQAAA